MTRRWCRGRGALASGAVVAATAGNHASREIFFGEAPDGARTQPRPHDARDDIQPEWNFAFANGKPPSPPPRSPCSGEDTANSVARPGWFGAMIAELRRRCARLLPVEWRIASQRADSGETIVASFGSVAVCRIPAGCFAVTCVNGEPAQARETALRRLANYLDGDNRGGVRLAAERPIIQQQVGPRRWRISVRLCTSGTALSAPAPRAPKVKVLALDSAWLAVVHVAGRPTDGKVASGDTIALDAITNSAWVAIGAPMIRLYAAGPVQWLFGGFEIAVPVAPRHWHTERRDSDGSPDPLNLPAGCSEQ